jgi:hypothetical protein
MGPCSIIEILSHSNSIESPQHIEQPSTWDCIIAASHQGTAQGLRHMAQGKNNKRRLILSLCLAPCASHLMSQTSSAGKAFELWPASKDQVFDVEQKMKNLNSFSSC